MDARSQQELRENEPKLRERPSSAVREAPTDVPWLAGLWTSPSAGFLLSATLPGLFLALVGPFGSFAAPLWMRLAYWVPTMAIGAFAGAALTVGLEQVPFLRVRPFLRMVAISTAMTGFMTFVAALGGTLVFGPNTVQLSWTLVFYVFVITLVMVFVVGVARARAFAPGPEVDRLTPPSPDAVPAAQPLAFGPKLIARLNPKLKAAAILALEAEDHYVRVHTDQGSELVLMRLADAIAEMGTIKGARTHRSWWVARSAVKEARRADGRATLILSNGAEVPISRNAVSELVEKGWL